MKKTLLVIAKVLALIPVIAVAAIFATSVSPIYRFEKPAPFSGPDIFNPYQGIDWNTGWKRANFHTHTRVGGPLNECPLWPDSVCLDYMKMGYDILTFSNHNELTVHPFDTALQVNVYEHGYNLFKFHKLVFGSGKVNRFDALLPFFTFQKQWQYDLLQRDSDFIVMNHPDRTDFVTGHNMRHLTGYRFMEGDSGVNTEFAHWDEALSAGHYSFCMANDDCHNTRRSDRFAVRCNFLNSPSAGYGDIRATLLSGRFYAMRIPDYGDGVWDIKYEKNRRLPSVTAIGVRQDTVFMALSCPAETIKVIGQDHETKAVVHDSDTLTYAMSEEDPYVRLTAFFDDGAVIYSQPFARYDKSKADSPYRESPHKLNYSLTLLYNLLLIILFYGCICIAARLFPYKKPEA